MCYCAGARPVVGTFTCLLCCCKYELNLWELLITLQSWCKVKGSKGAVDNLQSRHKPLCQYSDRDQELETAAQWNEERPAGPADQESLPFAMRHFQLSFSTLVTIYEHDLSTLQLLYSAGDQPLPPPTTSTPPSPSTPLTLWPAVPTTCNMQNQMCIMYVLKCKHTQTHWQPLCSHGGVSGYSSAQAQRWVIKKIQYSKCTRSPAYQYIIRKGDRWGAIRGWKAIEFAVSLHLQLHQSAAVDNWIKKEMWLTSSSKKLKLPRLRSLGAKTIREISTVQPAVFILIKNLSGMWELWKVQWRSGSQLNEIPHHKLCVNPVSNSFIKQTRGGHRPEQVQAANMR